MPTLPRCQARPLEPLGCLHWQPWATERPRRPYCVVRPAFRPAQCLPLPAVPSCSAGKQYNTLRAVQLPVATDFATPFFQSSGVRKAVALARLVDALHAWCAA